MLSRKGFVYFLIALVAAACTAVGASSELTGKWISQNRSATYSSILTGDLEFTADGVVIPAPENTYTQSEIVYRVVAPGKMRISWDKNDEVVSYQIDQDSLVITVAGAIFTYSRDTGKTDSQPNNQVVEQPAPSATLIQFPVSQEPLPTATSPAPTLAALKPTPTRDTRLQLTASAKFITPTPVMRFPLPKCAGTQLKVGDTGFIAWDTTPNRLRTTPDTHPSNNFVDDGRVPPGGILEILDGPVCNYGWVLWYVRTTWDVEGWTPETDGDEYWILPIATRQICPKTRPTRMIAGHRAFVEEEPDDPVEVFKEMAATFDDPKSILYKIKPKEQVDLLEGPFCDGKGANWWKVKTKTGVTGWIRENDGVKPYYFMAPVP